MSHFGVSSDGMVSECRARVPGTYNCTHVRHMGSKREAIKAAEHLCKELYAAKDLFERKSFDYSHLNLQHFSKNAISDLNPSAPQDDRITDKPVGFWVSDENEFGWKQWCEIEGFREESLSNCAKVSLKPDANVLLISTEGELREFDARFGELDDDETWRAMGLSRRMIRWDKVAELYDGIIISPYQSGTRMDIQWYYSWDVASGCIWNSDAMDISYEP